MKNRLDHDSESFIDVLRGLAAFGVLITHAVEIGIAGVYGDAMETTPVSWRWARASIGHGGFMVWCFFVLSGLCIHQSIARGMKSGGFSWRRYATARVTRIYPLFLFGLLLAVVVWWLVDARSGQQVDTPWPQLVSSLFSLQMLTFTFPYYDPSWSLSNEMIYYFAWPLALVLCGGRNVRRAFWVSMMATFVAAAGIMLLWKGLHRFEQSTLVRGMWTIIVLMPLWLCGAWLGEAWNSQRARVSLNTWLWFIPLCGTSALVLVVLKFLDVPDWVTDVAGVSSIPGLMILVAGGHHLRLASKKWTLKAARWLGQFSYPCYVLHFQVMILINRMVLNKLGGGVAASPILRALLLMLPTLLLLALIGPWMERTTMSWRSRVMARR